ncbi:MAG: GTP-binding protein [Motiliproteus sp.]|nr:GTP-binding protein [Motiliproteus sp.]MCW9051928.1 GTP-binding protein [Motiliproteus sp.]
MPKKIPVNIITGFLGVGKTTAIQNLLAQKPEGEKWAVLVNEFGQIGIDQAAFDPDQGVVIKELPGGCICCTLGLPLTMSLVMLLQRHKPDRLVIEPTGIGHPAGIMDTLHNEPFREALDVRATICLVDPRSLDDPKVLAHEIFQDQINIADVLVINKTDLAPAEQTSTMKQRGLEMFPPKAAVTESVQGQFDLALLDQVAGQMPIQYPQAHASDSNDHSHHGHDHKHHNHSHDHNHDHDHKHDAQEQARPLPGTPVTESGDGYGHWSYSWLFHADDTFDQDRLSLWCYQQKEIQRIKGALRIGSQWILLNQVLGEQVVSPLAWRRDSRIELISTTPLDADSLTKELLECLKPTPISR